MDEIIVLARKYKLLIIEDTAEAHGALYKNKLVGTFGDAGCFSFYANKLITTGEGGMIITNNQKLYKKLVKLRAYYFSDKMHFWHEHLAWNLRMSALEAALGLAQLSRLEELIGLRRKNAQYYTKNLKSLSDYLIFPSEKKNIKSVFWMYGLVLKKGNRDELMKFLEKNGVETRTYFFPMHWQPIYKEKNSYPVADWLGKNGLYLPSSSHLTKKQKNTVIKLIKKFFSKL
jgi:perosamine synthetase